MARDNKGTMVGVDANELPSGYTKPSDVSFDDYETKYENEEITVAKSGVENATATTTMANIVSAVETAVNAIIDNDFDTANTVEVYSNITAIGLNMGVNQVRFTNGAINYVCTVDIFVKTS